MRRHSTFTIMEKPIAQRKNCYCQKYIFGFFPNENWELPNDQPWGGGRGERSPRSSTNSLSISRYSAQLFTVVGFNDNPLFSLLKVNEGTAIKIRQKWRQCGANNEEISKKGLQYHTQLVYVKIILGPISMLFLQSRRFVGQTGRLLQYNSRMGYTVAIRRAVITSYYGIGSIF